MTDLEFKKKNRPAICTSDPVFDRVPKNKYHELLNIARQTARNLGYDEYDLGCSKRHVCNGECTGRPILALKIPELKPYVDQIKHMISDDDMIYINNCSNCEIKKTCKTACKQVSDLMQRNMNKDDIMMKSNEVYISNENSLSTWLSESSEDGQPGIIKELIDRYGSIQSTIENLPWGAISNKRQKLVRMYIFEGKDFRACAKELKYANFTVSRNEFYRSLTTLSKFATIRYFIELNRDSINDLDLELLNLKYYEFLTISQIAERLNLKVGTISSRLFRFMKRSKLKYSRFGKKNKIIPSRIF